MDEILDIDSFCQMGEMPVKRARQTQPGDKLGNGDAAGPSVPEAAGSSAASEAGRDATGGADVVGCGAGGGAPGQRP